MYGYVDTSEMISIKTIYTAFAQRFDINYYFGGEHHDFWEIVVVLEGRLGVTAGSDIFVLGEGQAVIHEPMEFHRLWSEGNSRPKIIIFSFAATGIPRYRSKVFGVSDLKKPSEILTGLRESYEFSGVNAIGVKKGSFPKNQIILKELEIFILEGLSNPPYTPGIEKSQTAKNYAKIIEVMENNINTNLSVGEIAEMCHMSEVNLKKTFSRYSGMGVMAYFNNMKIKTAVKMIENGVSVKETAAALGFSNQNYFSTVFKRIMGSAPVYFK